MGPLVISTPSSHSQVTISLILTFNWRLENDFGSAKTYLNFTILMSDGFLLIPDLLLQSEFLSAGEQQQEIK